MKTIIITVIIIFGCEFAINLNKKLVVDKSTALEFLQTELFNTACEDKSDITSTVILSSSNKNDFWIVNLTKSKDVPESEYNNYCEKVVGGIPFQIDKGNNYEKDFFKSSKFIIDYGKYCKYDKLDEDIMEFEINVAMNFKQNEHEYIFFSFLIRYFTDFYQSHFRSFDINS